ncbi:MAG: recR [Chloroflexi bacterium]|nr:recR [Chloroflexota bacterium]
MSSPLIEPVARLIEALNRLPGIGPKTAQRLTYHLLRAPDAEARALAAALVAVREQVVLCEVCFNFSDAPRCPICRDGGREQRRLCVVEEPLDVLALEREEVILATNPTLEGEATAMYLDERLAGRVGSVTRIARGIPVGGDLEYADEVTLIRALQGRRALSDRRA